jgi:hypothetical protein
VGTAEPGITYTVNMLLSGSQVLAESFTELVRIVSYLTLNSLLTDSAPLARAQEPRSDSQTHASKPLNRLFLTIRVTADLLPNLLPIAGRRGDSSGRRAAGLQ